MTQVGVGRSREAEPKGHGYGAPKGAPSGDAIALERGTLPASSSRTTALKLEQSRAAAAAAVFFFLGIRFRGVLGFRGMVS